MVIYRIFVVGDRCWGEVFKAFFKKTRDKALALRLPKRAMARYDWPPDGFVTGCLY